MTARTITVPGEPIAKGRPRFYAGRAYTPARTREYDEKIRTAYMARYGNMDPLAGPVSVCVSAYFKIPQGWNKQKTADAEHDEILPTKKPDVDNVVKSALDGLNGQAWQDDSQVVRLAGNKYYSDTPRMEITVYPVAGDGNKGQRNEA